MVSVDLLLVVLAVIGTLTIVLRWRFLNRVGALTGASFVLLGLWASTAPFIADFATMIVLPPIIGMQESMRLMTAVHLQFSWYLNSVAAVLTLAGLMLLVWRLSKQFKQLEDSEERFKDFAESISDWFWEMDANLRFTYFSPTFERVTGVRPDALLGKTREETGIPGVSDDAFREHLSTLHSRKSFRDFRHTRNHPDGRLVHIAINGRPRFDDSGRFVGYRGTGRDVSKQVQAEIEREEALQRAQAANRTKSEFLAMMSHDFRTPLNAILGYSELIESEALGPDAREKYREYATDINQSGQRMLRLVSDILEISAIEAGKRVISQESVTVDEMLRVCAKELSNAAAEKNVEIDINCGEDVPNIEADPRAMHQIVQNLVSNAIKYSNKGGKVAVSAEFGGNSVAITIRDEGDGIPDDMLTRIREPFMQAKRDPHVANEGSGLGLAIVDTLVKQHGGTVDIDSEVGKGTSVCVSLPVELDASAA